MSAALPTSDLPSQAGADAPHIPVLCAEVVAALAPQPGERMVDGTFGAGGYSRALLRAEPSLHIEAIDRDPQALAAAEQAAFADRLTLHHSTFGQVAALLAGQQVDGLVVDLGVSSMQLDQAERGFSFRFDGPLDMRMDPTRGATAADLVNSLEEQELARILWLYGEEQRSRAIARALVARRQLQPFARTADLADCIRAVVKYAGGIDPATRSFQGLRIAVNDELGELERLLDASLTVLRPGGRLVVVTFHSLEDRLVKRFLAAHSGGGRGVSRHAPASAPQPVLFELLGRKPQVAGAAELAANPRARSAKLRAARRTALPAALVEARR